MKKYMKRILSTIFVSSILICGIATTKVSAMESSSIKEGYYTLKNIYSEKNLNILGGKTSNNTNINIYKENGKKNQIYKIDKINKSYQLMATNTSTSKVVSVKGIL